MDFNCDECGRGHSEESNSHFCNHSLCFTCNKYEHGCPCCILELQEKVNIEAERERERERREAEEARVNEVTECCICMDTIQITNRAVTECGHVFCLGCLLQHLTRKNDCPMCRHIVGLPLRPRASNYDAFWNDDVLYNRILMSITQPRQQAQSRQQAQPRQQARRCGICGEPGHNRRTCRQVHGVRA